jgi:hypothetical protein
MPDTRTARVGVHARNDFDFTDGDYRLVCEARIETLKILSFTKTEVFDRLRRENPLLEFIVRLHDIRIGQGHPSAEAFATTAIPRLNELRPFAVKFEIHNEPNHDQRFEGWGSTDDDARSFRDWYLEVVRRLKAACPWAQFGFPGLAPNWPHRDLEWLELCKEAVVASDWLGCHCYWQSDNMFSADWGLRFKAYHEKFPDKVIEITEFGNATRNLSCDDLAAQYVAFYSELFNYPYLGSASAFIASSSDPQWAPFVWRKENGELLPVVRQVGGIQRPALVLPKPTEETPPPYRVQWLDVKRPDTLQAGQRASVGIKLMNAGTKTWAAGTVRLGYHWLTLDGQAVSGAEDLRTSLPADITPGMIVTLSQAQLAAPAVSGDYILRWDLVEGEAGWFAAKGSPAYDLRITVGPSTVGDELYFAETESSIKAPFLSFYRKYGRELFGVPIANAFADDGMLTQYFERAALEQSAPDEVRLKAVGSEAWAARARIVELDSRVCALTEEVALLRGALSRALPGVASRPEIHDLIQTLTHDGTQSYATRSLSDIKTLIVHHTAVPASVGPEPIARYHVKERGWPGIGYHFMIMGDGTIDQTNGLQTISYHARQANASSVGIAFAGNFMAAGPTEAQLEAGGELLSYLIQLLGLPRECIKGHRDFVATACPGDQWWAGLVWRDQLLARVVETPEVAQTSDTAQRSVLGVSKTSEV